MDRHKLKISAVSYLNTKPFLEGMERSGFLDRVDLSLDIPSLCASKLLEGSVDHSFVEGKPHHHRLLHRR
jgi:chorismate dehydratase